CNFSTGRYFVSLPMNCPQHVPCTKRVRLFDEVFVEDHCGLFKLVILDQGARLMDFEVRRPRDLILNRLVSFAFQARAADPECTKRPKHKSADVRPMRHSVTSSRWSSVIDLHPRPQRQQPVSAHPQRPKSKQPKVEQPHQSDLQLREAH